MSSGTWAVIHWGQRKRVQDGATILAMEHLPPNRKQREINFYFA